MAWRNVIILGVSVYFILAIVVQGSAEQTVGKGDSPCQWNTTIFTALHAMQTRSYDEISVRPSVCPSVRLSVCQTRAL